MTCSYRMIPALLVLALLASAADAQDPYDPTVLRTFALQFHDADWEARLRANYDQDIYILADLTVEGVTYPSVGVRIRGNSSYFYLPSGSQKFSLKIETAHVNPDQKVMGYETFNLNNGFQDPTFSREVVYNNFVGQFIPNIRANNVVVTLNGANWGVYNNVEQGNKAMLRRYFPNPDGARITCSNKPNGPGLAYAGTNPASYRDYEVNNDGGYADAITSVLIPVTQLLSSTTSANWQATDARFAIDPSIWSIVLESALTDDDSYVNKGCDFAVYTDPLDNRMHLIQRDNNETFKYTWSPTMNFSAPEKPVLSRVIAGVPELRQRYFAHYRSVRSQLNWATFGELFAANRALIESAVQADPKRLYSFQNFQDGFGNSTVNLRTEAGTVPPGPGGFGYGSIMGLQQFFTQRNNTLNGTPELTASGPAVSALRASSDTPAAGTPVWITAAVAAAAGLPVSKVELFYRSSAATTYQRATMLDDGASGDGAAGDGVYGASLPLTGDPGQVVRYYVAATSGNTYSSLTFLPALAERGPRSLEYQLAAAAGMRLTEWMYQGASGEFMEFTNLSDQPIDLTGWSVDDDHAVAGTFSLTPFGVVQPGESVIVTESPAAAFRAAWGLDGSVKIIGDYGTKGFPGNSLGRSDQINLYDNAQTLVDRLSYGDQTIPGSPRTQNASGQAPCSVIGRDDAAGWTLSAVGDAFGSERAVESTDVGTPGRFHGGICAGGEEIFSDGFDRAP